MVTYRCSMCGFKYTPKGNSNIYLKCGNCGSTSSVKATPDANQILEESTF